MAKNTHFQPSFILDNQCWEWDGNDLIDNSRNDLTYEDYYIYCVVVNW